MLRLLLCVADLVDQDYFLAVVQYYVYIADCSIFLHALALEVQVLPEVQVVGLHTDLLRLLGAHQVDQHEQLVSVLGDLVDEQQGVAIFS